MSDDRSHSETSLVAGQMGSLQDRAKDVTLGVNADHCNLCQTKSQLTIIDRCTYCRCSS